MAITVTLSLITLFRFPLFHHKFDLSLEWHFNIKVTCEPSVWADTIDAWYAHFNFSRERLIDDDDKVMSYQILYWNSNLWIPDEHYHRIFLFVDFTAFALHLQSRSIIYHLYGQNHDDPWFHQHPENHQQKLLWNSLQMLEPSFCSLQNWLASAAIKYDNEPLFYQP